MCCYLLAGGITTGIYSMIAYTSAFSLEVWWIIESNGTLPVVAYILATGYFLVFLTSVFLMVGLILRKQPYLLVWLFMMILFFFPECGLVLFMSLYYWGLSEQQGVIELGFFVFRAVVNVLCIVLIQQLFSSWREEKAVMKRLETLNISGSMLTERSMPFKENEVEYDNGHIKGVYMNGSHINGGFNNISLDSISTPVFSNGKVNHSNSNFSNGHLNNRHVSNGHIGNGKISYSNGVNGHVSTIYTPGVHVKPSLYTLNNSYSNGGSNTILINSGFNHSKSKDQKHVYRSPSARVPGVAVKVTRGPSAVSSIHRAQNKKPKAFWNGDRCEFDASIFSTEFFVGKPRSDLSMSRSFRSCQSDLQTATMSFDGGGWDPRRYQQKPHYPQHESYFQPTEFETKSLERPKFRLNGLGRRSKSLENVNPHPGGGGSSPRNSPHHYYEEMDTSPDQSIRDIAL